MALHNQILDDQNIEGVVLRVLREEWRPPLLDWIKEKLLNTPRREIKLTDRLVGDVWGSGDDASIFVLKLEKRLGIIIPPEEWSRVRTVQEIIDIFERHRPQAE